MSSDDVTSDEEHKKNSALLKVELKNLGRKPPDPAAHDRIKKAGSMLERWLEYSSRPNYEKKAKRVRL